jgi:TetR/AcrR family transcriptional regulator, transcriptional repressor for nem operon
MRSIMTKGEQTRQFIIEQSAALFNIKGIAATAMSDVMEATKLSKGSLYVHFDNKDVLASVVVDYNLELLNKTVKASIARQRTAKAKLYAFVDVLKDAVDSPVKGGCPMLNFGMESDDTNYPIKHKVNAMIDEAVKTISKVIKEGIKNREFKTNWNAREFATMMFAMIEGGVMMSRVAGNNASIDIVAKQLKKLIADQTT